jgi:putative hydrolase of HD superfamily
MADDVRSRVARQIAFVLELDKAKQILRQNPLTDGSRAENDAEHMWHLAVMALVLAEHAAERVDVQRVLELVLFHDVVEIDAGDAYVYDDEARLAKAELEAIAAERIYGLLPDDQEERFKSLWQEYEAGESAEARFASALDRLAPLLLNHAAEGGAWLRHKPGAARVRSRNSVVGEHAPALGPVVDDLIADAVARGLLKDE